MSDYARTDQEPEFRQVLHHNLVSQEVLLRRASIVLSLMISIASFFGLRDIVEGDGWDAKVIPAVTAVGGGVLFWVAWHKLFSTLHLMDSGTRRSQLIVVASLVMQIQMLFSAWPVATTISGKNAVTVHLSRFTNQGRDILGKAYEGTLLQGGLVTKVESVASTVRSQANFEGSTGAGTGMKGDGLVVKAMNNFANRLDIIAGQMKDVLKSSDRLNEAGREVLREMDQLVADSSIKASDRQKLFGNLVSQFADIVHALNRIDITGLLDGTSVGIEYRSGTARQIAAFADMQRTTQKFVDELRAQSKPLKKTDPPRAPVFAPISPGMAVLAYASDLPMGWGIAIGLDILPFLLLIGTMISWLDSRLPPRYDHPFEPVTTPNSRPPKFPGRPQVQIVGEK